MQSPVYKEGAIAWSDSVPRKDIPDVAADALSDYAHKHKVPILSKFHSAFAWGYRDDDYTHIVVITTYGDAYMVEGASLRPTIVTKL
jgi:hypothetical protein